VGARAGASLGGSPSQVTAPASRSRLCTRVMSRLSGVKYRPWTKIPVHVCRARAHPAQIEDLHGLCGGAGLGEHGDAVARHDHVIGTGEYAQVRIVPVLRPPAVEKMGRADVAPQRVHGAVAGAGTGGDQQRTAPGGGQFRGFTRELKQRFGI